jgi:hypothetical protein
MVSRSFRWLKVRTVVKEVGKGTLNYGGRQFLGIVTLPIAAWLSSGSLSVFLWS